MKFEILSDVHLEMLNDEQIDLIIDKIKEIKQTDILCLVGDIGYPKKEGYRSFLDSCLKMYKNVIVIAGNHEYYGSIISHINDYIQNICIDLNKLYEGHEIHFLNNSHILCDDTLFVGSTLWSRIYDHIIIEQLISDFSKIKIEKKNKKINTLTTYEYNQMHNVCIDYLRTIINEYPEYPIVVLTHHAPLDNDELMHPPNCRNNKMTSQAFCSNQQKLFQFNVEAWVFGHTHQEYKHRLINNDKNINCLIQSNPLGYMCEKLDTMKDHFLINLNE